jgi:WD40 repeat protein
MVDAHVYKALIWNDATERVSTSLEFKTAVLRVRISSTHLVVVQLNSVGIYKMKMPPEKVTSYETVNNPWGLCCLGKNIVAFPGLTPGQVKIYNLTTNNVSIVPAHNSPLRALALSGDETKVATASEQGTLVRLWSYPSCTKIMEFRRGIDPATIFSLGFSKSGHILAATSDKATLHVFDLPLASAEPAPKVHKWGMLSKIPLLPRQFSDTYASATIKFELGDESVHTLGQRSETLNAAIPGVPGGSPTRGLLGWIDDDTLVIIGAGSDATWQKFIVGYDEAGARVIVKEGWKKYLER